MNYMCWQIINQNEVKNSVIQSSLIVLGVFMNSKQMKQVLVPGMQTENWQSFPAL